MIIGGRVEEEGGEQVGGGGRLNKGLVKQNY